MGWTTAEADAHADSVKGSSRAHDWTCPIISCGRRFTDRFTNFRDHVRTHVAKDSVQLSCTVPGCGTTFTKPGTMTRHLKNVHGIVPVSAVDSPVADSPVSLRTSHSFSSSTSSLLLPNTPPVASYANYHNHDEQSHHSPVYLDIPDHRKVGGMGPIPPFYSHPSPIDVPLDSFPSDFDTAVDGVLVDGQYYRVLDPEEEEIFTRGYQH